MNSQQSENEHSLGFQYGVAPSLGKHQLETYRYFLKGQKKIFQLPVSYGFQYLNTRFSYFEVPGEIGLEEYERLHLLKFNLGIEKAISPNWAFSVTMSPMLASNFSTGLESEDALLGFHIGLKKNWAQASLYVGLERGTVFGLPSYYPHVRFSQKMGEHFNWEIGFPSSEIKWTINERHSLVGKANAVGNSYHITGNSSFLSIEDFSEGRLNFTNYQFSMEHTYRIQPKVTTSVQLGWLFNNSLEVETANGTGIYGFETGDSLYFSMGFQYNLTVR